jgi:membrane protein
MAAALAFYTMLSLAPLLVLTITIAGLLVEPKDARAEVTDQIRMLVGPEGAQQIHNMLKSAGRHGQGIFGDVLSVLVLIYGATSVVAQLQSSLNEAWKVEPDPKRGGVRNFLIKRLLSLTMILGIAFLLLISLVLTTIASAFGDKLVEWLPGEVSAYVPLASNTGVFFLLVTLLFAAMFKILPDARVAWSDVWIGAAGTALLFIVGKFLIDLHLSHSNLMSTYGAAGSLVLVLLWTYYSSMIFLFGAEFTQVWARRTGKPIEPRSGAVRVVRKKERSEPHEGKSS